MKLRINGNSIRLRVSCSDLQRLIDTGRIEETIHFGLNQRAKLTYSVEHGDSGEPITLRYQPQEVTVVLSSDALRQWADSVKQVGVYGRLDALNGQLDVLLEKDFACLDGSDNDNEDTFPNPNSLAVC